MSADWEEIIRAGIKQFESDVEDAVQAIDEWMNKLWDADYHSSSSRYYYDQGNVLQIQKRYAEAIKQYSQAINLDREYYLAYFYRGSCHSQLKRYKQSLKDYDRSIIIKPDFTDGYYYRGFVRQSLGDLVGAIEDFSKVIKLNPDKIDAYFHRAATYSSTGDHSSAIEDFSKLIDFAPTANKYYNRGVTRYQMTEYNQAIADFEEAIKLDPSFIAAYINLGNSHYALGNAEQATHNYEKVEQIEGESTSKDEHEYYARAIAALNQEELEKSIELLRIAAFLCQENNNLALNLEIIKITNKIKLSK